MAEVLRQLLLSPALLPAAASAPQPNLHPLSDLLDIPIESKLEAARWELEVDILAKSRLERALCLTHHPEVVFGSEHRSARLTLQDTGLLHGPFALLVRAADIHEPKVFLQRSFKHPQEIAAGLSFFPNFAEGRLNKAGAVAVARLEDPDAEAELEGSGEFIFVLDRSGSMGGSRMAMAKQAARLFIQSLPSDCYFNVVSFGSMHASLFPKSIKYSQATLEQALAKIAEFDADMGGTEIYGPLQFIYAQSPLPEYPRNVFLITDGDVSSPQIVIDLIRAHSKAARVHSFGIGSGASR